MVKKTALDLTQEVLDRMGKTPDNLDAIDTEKATALAHRIATQGYAINSQHALSRLRDTELKSQLQQILDNTDSEQRKRGLIAGVVGAGMGSGLGVLGGYAGRMTLKTHLPQLISLGVIGALGGGLPGYMYGKSKAKENAIREALVTRALEG